MFVYPINNGRFKSYIQLSIAFTAKDINIINYHIFRDSRLRRNDILFTYLATFLENNQNILIDLKQKLNTVIVLTTHDFIQAKRIGDFLFIINNHKIDNMALSDLALRFN